MLILEEYIGGEEVEEVKKDILLFIIIFLIE